MNKLSEMIAEMCPEGVEYVTLKECCLIWDNKRKPITKSSRELGIYPYYGANGIQDYVAGYILTANMFLLVRTEALSRKTAIQLLHGQVVKFG